MNLLSVQGRGAVVSVLIFLICFILVHAFRLARFGWRTMRKKLPPEKPKPADPEPVYYIVERKKKRAKAEYDNPKRIQFKDR